MAIPTYEHIIEAVQTAVRKHGGVKMVAADMDMAPSSLGNLLNPYADRSSVKLGLEQALWIMQRTGDHSALVLMAKELGYGVVPINARPDKDLAGEQLDDVQALAQVQAAIARGAPRDEIAVLVWRLFCDVAQTQNAAEAALRDLE